MATSKLMEAAAEILAGSKSKAGADPMQKMLGAEVEDLGGPTPQNSKPDDDSNKIHASKGAKSATAPTTKPSAASADPQLLTQEEFNELSGEDQELYLEALDQLNELSNKTLHSYLRKTQVGGNSDLRQQSKTSNELQDYGRDSAKDRIKARKGALDRSGYEVKDGKLLATKGPNIPKGYMKKEDMHDDEKKKEMMKKKMKEDINSLFADDSTISEEFKDKAFTIFEARVNDQVSQIEEEIDTHYASVLEEAVEDIKKDLTDKVDDYLNYVVEQWLAENEIAIESGLRAELTEEFIAGLRNLFAEHYIDVPTEKVDLVDELASKVEELEGKLDEEIERGISYAKALVESRKNELTREVTDGLTTTQVEKIKSLAESVDFSTEEEYTYKLETIRENYFPSGAKKATQDQLHEQVEDTPDQKVISDPFVAAVSQAISKTKI